MKKLSVKTNKTTGKLVIHKNKPQEEPVEEEVEEEEEELPFDPDPVHISGKLNPHKAKKGVAAPIGSTFDQSTPAGIVHLMKIEDDEWEIIEPVEVEEEEPIGNEAVLGKPVIGNTHIEKKTDTATEVSDESEEVAEAKVSGPAANVGYGIARTINLGNYESVKISVDIHVPSEVDEDEIDGNYEFAKGWCEEKITQIVKEYTE